MASSAGPRLRADRRRGAGIRRSRFGPPGPHRGAARRGPEGAGGAEVYRPSLNVSSRAAADDATVLTGARRGAIAAPAPRELAADRPKRLANSSRKSVVGSRLTRRASLSHGDSPMARAVAGPGLNLLTPGANWRHPLPSELMRIGGTSVAWHRAADSSPLGRLAPGALFPMPLLRAGQPGVPCRNTVLLRCGKPNA
jgi:hypothetical protein